MKIKKLTALALSGALAASVLTGCGSVDKDAAVAVLDGQEIKLGIANFAARLQQAQYDDFYTAYFGQEVWTSDLYGNGTTMEDNLKDGVMESVENFYVLQKHMADYDVALTEEETGAVKKAAESFMAANSAEALEALGATQEIVEEYLTLITIESKMYEAVIVDADTNVSDEEANTSAYSYVGISKTTYTDEEGTSKEYTKDEQTELAGTVKEFCTAAKESTLDTAADEYGYTVNSGTFTADDTALDEAVLTALQGLSEEDEISDVVETDNYYYVLRLDEITDEQATEQHREEIINKRQSDLYNEVLQGWKDEAEWKVNEKVWKTVSFDNLFTTTVPSTEETDETESVENTETAQ